MQLPNPLGHSFFLASLSWPPGALCRVRAARPSTVTSGFVELDGGRPFYELRRPGPAGVFDSRRKHDRAVLMRLSMGGRIAIDFVVEHLEFLSSLTNR